MKGLKPYACRRLRRSYSTLLVHRPCEALRSPQEKSRIPVLEKTQDSTITCIQLQMPLLHLHYSRHGHVDVYFVRRQSQTRTT